MNKFFLLFIIVIIFNYFGKVQSENSNYIILILRNKLDNNYDDESPKVQYKINKLVNDRMNDIYDVIIKKKNTYKLKNGKLDKKLNELKSLPLIKREEGKEFKYLFQNEVRKDMNIDMQKRSFESYNSGNSTIEYIPFESILVKHVCPVLNYYAISAYLSEEAAEIVCKLSNVVNCEKSKTYHFKRSIQNEDEDDTQTDYSDDYDEEVEDDEDITTEKESEIIENVNENDNENDANDNEIIHDNENENENNNVDNKYYDIEAIKKETKWKDVSVQEFPYETNHLSLISQSPFIDGDKTLDKNFYYPSSAGQGINIYFLDQGLNINHEDYDTYEGTPYERTVACDAISTNDHFHISNDEEKKNCNLSDKSIPNHGIMVTSVAGGKIFGVSKKANLHMIAIDATLESVLKGFDYITQNAEPHKTVISLSFGGDRYTVAEYNKIKELIQKGYIVIAAAGNEGEYCCGDIYSEKFHSMAGYRLAIIAGATKIEVENNGYEKADFSNFGDCVDIHGPGYVSYPNLSSNSSSDFKLSYGTSCSTPLIAGVAASIMSEHPEIKFDNELMRKTLIDMSIKDSITDLRHSGSGDTPNRFVNNGKRSVFSPENVNIQCGILSGNVTISCPDGCCSKEGKCISPKNDPLKKCLIENGCQTEFGYCTSKDKSIDECKKELKEYEECQVEISSEMDENDLMQSCKSFKSSKCEEFYKNQYTEKSVCSVAKKNNNVTFGFIDDFNRKKYHQFVDFCDESMNKKKEECSNALDKYKNCFIENFDDLNISSLDQLLDICHNYDNNECVKFYENVSEILSDIPSCSIIKDTYSMDYFKYNIIYTENYLYKNERFNNVYCEKAATCENELNENGYEECKFEINFDMEEDEIMNNCSLFKSDKCQKLYNLKDDEESSCHSIIDQLDLDIGFDAKKYKKNEGICDEKLNDLMYYCKENLEYYNRCYKNDLNELYVNDPDSLELSQDCHEFNSEKCANFYENPVDIINEIESCSTLNKFYSDEYVLNDILNIDDISGLQDKYNTNTEICSNINSKESFNNELCENELQEYSKCQVTISTDLEDKELLKNCNAYRSFHCIDFYNRLINDKSSCSSVKDQYEFISNFDEDIHNQNNDICYEIIDRYIGECKENFEPYEKCMDDSIEDLHDNHPYSLEFTQRCSDLHEGDCAHFYQNTKEIINEIPVCSILREALADDDEEEEDESFYIEVFDKVPNVLNMNYEIYTDLCNGVNENENYTKELCENEINKYSRCQIEISSDMKEEELLSQCQIYKESFCTEFYEDLYTQSSVCYSFEDTPEYLKNFTEEKYNQYNDICDSLIDKYTNECKKGIDQYNKCFEKDLEDLYDEDPDSEELRQGCLDLTSEECVNFYNNPKGILRDVPVCSKFSEFFSPDFVIEKVVGKTLSKIKSSNKRYTRTCNKLEL